ncbi:MAG: hypothetical protein LBS64_04380 [Spirochaetaceae bacterium]|jgi:hypothetical protein|nr:hypothetical protein [Spirochaetaceae bacterium]
MRARKKIFCRAAFLIPVCAAFLSCGLEEAVMLESPIEQRSTAGSIDPQARYFTFIENGENFPPVGYSGYEEMEVYYRIYATESQMQSDRASIASANTQYSSNGYNAIISRKYSELNVRGTLGGRTEIRLFTETPYVAGVWVNPSTGEGAGYSGSPSNVPDAVLYRNFSSTSGNSAAKGFDFRRESESDSDAHPRPKDGDSDTQYAADGTEWFVNAYAVSAGRNITTLQPVYSQLLELGWIRIPRT